MFQEVTDKIKPEELETSNSPKVLETKQKIIDTTMHYGSDSKTFNDIIGNNAFSEISRRNYQDFSSHIGSLEGIGRLDRTAHNTTEALGNVTSGDYLTLDRWKLTQLYSKIGIIKNTIDQPIADAFKGKIKIKFSEAPDSTGFTNYLLDMGVFKAVAETLEYADLFGGAALLVNSNEDFPDVPVNPANIKSDTKLRLHPIDRWDITWYGPHLNNKAYGRNVKINTSYIRSNNMYDPEWYYIYGKCFHRSRVHRVLSKRPTNTMLHMLDGWGLSKLEGSVRAFNLYFRGSDVLFTLVNELKVDVVNLKGLHQAMGMQGSYMTLLERAGFMAKHKNAQNLLILDSEDSFDQKHITFSGVSDLLYYLMVGVSSSCKMPVEKQWGLATMAFSSGETAMEDYYSNIESDVRVKAKRLLRQVIPYYMVKRYGRIFPFDIEFEPLRTLSATEEQAVKTSKINNLVTLYANQFITPERAIQVVEEEQLYI